MNIVLTTEVIHPGGAETFVLRLATALKQRGHDVQLFIFYKDGFRHELVTRLAPNVPLHIANIPMNGLLQKLDGLFFRLKWDISFRKSAIASALKKLLSEHNTDIIHSHLLKSDEVTLLAGNALGVPVVTTIHGDYLQFFEKSQNGVRIPLLNYLKKATANLQSLKKVVCISDKQLQFFKQRFPQQTTGKLTKIYNGYESKAVIATDKRKQLGISPDEFVFGMVSRGIPDKGWERAITAFKQLGNVDAHLVLVGGGEHLDVLQKKYEGEDRLHFAGHSDEPLEWIRIFDAGLLPTTYPSESLPTVVIEYLYAGKPVIASEAGEIRNMLIQSGKVAGIVLPLEHQAMIADLTKSMKQYLDDKPLYEQHKGQALACFEAFRMDYCIKQYEAVYEEAIKSNKNS